MTLAHVARLLRDLRRQRGGLAARGLLRDLRQEVARTPLDAEQASHVETIFRDHGQAPPDHQIWKPGVGEAHMLLFAPELAEIGRLRFAPSELLARRDPSLGHTARQQLHASFEALVQLLGRGGCGAPRGLAQHVISLDRAHSTTQADGASGGLAACIALLSCWLDLAPRADTAATAGVTPDGRLLAVEHVGEKARALRRAYPDVSRLLVAEDAAKSIGQLPEGLELVPVASLGAALAEAGLRPDASRLPPQGRRAARAELHSLEAKHVEDYRADQWASFSEQAFMLAHRFHDDPIHRARALAHAALFALHAGAADRARGYLDQLGSTESDLDTVTRTQVLVTRATTMIDHEPAAAIRPAKESVDLARGLKEPERSYWLGRALGTLGRARLHAGRSQEALGPLTEAYEFHLKRQPEEAPRSAAHLATAHRHAGNPQRSLELCEQARTLVERYGSDEAVRTTSLFLDLEMARCHRDLGQLAAAEECARRLLQATALASDASYPRTAGLRMLASLAASTDRHDEAEQLWTRSLLVVETPTTPLMIRRIAAYALGEAILSVDRLPLRLDTKRLVTAWEAAHGDLDIEATLQAAVY